MFRKLFLAIGGAVILLTGIFLVMVAFPKSIEDSAPSWVRQHCKSCELNLGQLSLTIFPPGFILENPHFVQGDPKTTKVEAKVVRIVGRISPLKLLSGHIHLKSLTIQEPKVVVTEGDLKSPSEPSSGESKGDRSFWKTYSIEKTNLSGGDFIYKKIHNAHTASIHLENIEAGVGPWGTTPELKMDTTHAFAHGALENSGRFSLDVKTPLLAKDLEVNVILHIQGLDLSRINPYFETNDGIKLSGMLVDGQSAIAVRGPSLRGEVRLRYYGLGLHFEKTRERGPLAALVSNIAKSVKLVRANVDENPKEQIRNVQLKRTQESLITFMLRGMKTGALEIAI